MAADRSFVHRHRAVIITLLLGVVASFAKSLFDFLGGTAWNWWHLLGDLVVTVFLAAVVSVLVKVIQSDEERQRDAAQCRRVLLRLVPVLYTSVSGSSPMNLEEIPVPGGGSDAPLRADDVSVLERQEQRLVQHIDESKEFFDAARFLGTQEWSAMEFSDASLFMMEYTRSGVRERRLAAVEWAAGGLAAVSDRATGALAVAVTAARSRAFAVADQQRVTVAELRRFGLVDLESIGAALDQAFYQKSEHDAVETAAVIDSLSNLVGGSDAENPTDDSASVHQSHWSRMRSVVELFALERLLLDRWGAAVREVLAESKAVAFW